jgi:hypothetical protein
MLLVYSFDKKGQQRSILNSCSCTNVLGTVRIVILEENFLFHQLNVLTHEVKRWVKSGINRQVSL